MRDLPIMISVIDAPEKIAAAAEAIERYAGRRPDRDFRGPHRPAGAQPPQMEAADATGNPAKLLRIHLSESDRAGSTSRSMKRLSQKCREMKIAGATVFRGLEGYGETGEMHRSHLGRNDQPILISIVDTAENIAALIPAIEPMINTGMMAESEVRVIRVQKKSAAL